MAFKEDAKDFLDKSVEATKTAISKAGAAVHDFGDKSVVIIEIKQLEGKKAKAINKLGLLCYNCLKNDKVASTKDKDIKDVIDSLKDFDKEIDIRQQTLDKMKELSQKAHQKAKMAKDTAQDADDSPTK